MKVVYKGDHGEDPFVISFPHWNTLRDWATEIHRRQPSRHRDIPLLGSPPPYAIGATQQTSTEYSHLVAPPMQRHTPLNSPALPLYTPSLLAPLEAQTANPFDTLHTLYPCRPSLVSAVSASSMDEYCLDLNSDEKHVLSGPSNDISLQHQLSPCWYNKRKARRAIAGVFVLLLGGTFAYLGLAENYAQQHLGSTASLVQVS